MNHGLRYFSKSTSPCEIMRGNDSLLVRCTYSCQYIFKSSIEVFFYALHVKFVETRLPTECRIEMCTATTRTRTVVEAHNSV